MLQATEDESGVRDQLARTVAENPEEELNPERPCKTIEITGREKEIDLVERELDLEPVLDPGRRPGGRFPDAELALEADRGTGGTITEAITDAGAAPGVENAREIERGTDETPIGPEDGLDHDLDRELGLDRVAVVRDGDIEQVVYFNHFIIYIFVNDAQMVTEHRGTVKLAKQSTSLKKST